MFAYVVQICFFLDFLLFCHFGQVVSELSDEERMKIAEERINLDVLIVQKLREKEMCQQHDRVQMTVYKYYQDLKCKQQYGWLAWDYKSKRNGFLSSNGHVYIDDFKKRKIFNVNPRGYCEVINLKEEIISHGMATPRCFVRETDYWFKEQINYEIAYGESIIVYVYDEIVDGELVGWLGVSTKPPHNVVFKKDPRFDFEYFYDHTEKVDMPHFMNESLECTQKSKTKSSATAVADSGSMMYHLLFCSHATMIVWCLCLGM